MVSLEQHEDDGDEETNHTGEHRANEKTPERYCQLKALMSVFFRTSGEERRFFGLFS